MILPPLVFSDKGISETKSKQQSPCSNCMHQPVMPWGNACSTCMHKPVRCMHHPVTSQANACTYYMGSVVLISSRIYLIFSNFEFHEPFNQPFMRMDLNCELLNQQLSVLPLCYNHWLNVLATHQCSGCLWWRVFSKTSADCLELVWAISGILCIITILTSHT